MPDRLLVSLHAREGTVVVDRGRAGHELEPARGDRIGRGIDVIGADRDVLDAFALVALEIFLDLALVVGALVDRDADLAAGRGERAAGQTGELARDVEEADLTEIEGLRIEPVPGVHVATPDIVGQVVEIVEADPYGPGIAFAEPGEFRVVGRALRAIAVDEIEKRAADADHRRHVERLVGAAIFGGAERERAGERMLRIDHAPGHGRGAGAVHGNEASRVAVALAVDHVGDVALAIERDVATLVAGDLDIAHLHEQLFEQARLGMGELDELEAVRARRIFRADRGGRRVVGEGAHGQSSQSLPIVDDSRAPDAQKVCKRRAIL